MMIDGMPWPAQIGVAAGGWIVGATVALWVVRAFIRGDLFPSRTVDQLEQRNHAQEETIRHLSEANAILTKSTALSNAVMEELHRAATEGND